MGLWLSPEPVALFCQIGGPIGVFLLLRKCMADESWILGKPRCIEYFSIQVASMPLFYLKGVEFSLVFCHVKIASKMTVEILKTFADSGDRKVKKWIML